jgi:hypothetical protein
MLNSLSAVLLLGVIATACGGSDGSEVEGTANKGQGASSSTGGTPVLGGTTGSGGSNGSGATGTVIKPGDACATGTASAALSGVNMIVMFDRSTSMTEEANDAGASRWDLTSAALKAFFADPDEAGLKLALRFFPHDLPAEGCRQDRNNAPGCNVNACAMPLVPLGTLTADAAPTDAHEKALLDATDMSAPDLAQGTPIFAALGGALQWAAAQRTMTPDENSVVVLVTDGEANGCNNDIGDISQLAADALAADQIRTYAIGLTGSQQNDMDQIAEAGGTEKGIFVADGNDATQQLKDALGAIRGQVLDCDFPMPEAKPGIDVDPALINVNYTPSGGMESTLTQVANADACGATPSWYYDNVAAPTRIILCPSTCDTITSDPMASLQILLGCATSSEVPK